MDLSQIIRDIQKSEFEDKTRKIQDLFEEIYLKFPEQRTLLQVVEKAICDNLTDTVAKIDLPEDISAVEANKFTFKNLNLIIVAGHLGNYLSWDPKFVEDYLIKSICDRLFESTSILQEVKEIQKEFPQMEIQLLLTANLCSALDISLKFKKDIACVEKDTVFILFKNHSFPPLIF